MLFLIMAMPEDPGDRAFLEELYRDYHKLMYWAAKKYIDEEQDREDIVHDSLLRLIKKVAVLRSLDRAELTGYVMVTVRHAAYNYLRDQQLRRQLTPVLRQEEDHLEDDLIARLDARALLLALGQRMTEEERILLEGKFLLEKTDEELAELLHCKVSSLRTKLHRARCNLRKYQQEIEGGDGNDRY